MTNGPAPRLPLGGNRAPGLAIPADANVPRWLSKQPAPERSVPAKQAGTSSQFGGQTDDAEPLVAGYHARGASNALTGY